MATATIVQVYHDGTDVHVTARVEEGGVVGTVDYRASVSLADFNAAADTAAKRALLVAALVVVRDAQLVTLTSVDVTGTVTL